MTGKTLIDPELMKTEYSEYEPHPDTPILLGFFIGTFGVIGFKIFKDSAEGEDNVGWCVTFTLLGFDLKIFGLTNMPEEGEA